jgi:site-specific DNA-methyltransferase (adenine-specific)
MTKLIHKTGGDCSWRTPEFIFNYYNEIYQFQLDAAADDENALCVRYYTEEQNALIQEWSNSNFLNPPFSPNSLQKQFIHKAVTEACKDRTTVCLIPSRTETKIWQDFVFPYASVIDFLDERLHYSYCENPSGYPSAIVVFDSSSKKRFSGIRSDMTPSIIGPMQLRFMPGYKEYKEKIKANKEKADLMKVVHDQNV